MKTLLKGQTLTWRADPFSTPWQDAYTHTTQGGVLLENGTITEVGDGADLAARHPDAETLDYGAHLILPGFVDTHVHYPQTGIVNSWGKTLVDWLNTFTFPEEMRLADPSYGAEIAGVYCDLALSHGITTMCSFATSAPASVTAFMQAAQDRSLRAFAGKTCMDRNAPDGLCDTATRAYDESLALLKRWHGVDRLSYVITPRFAPTSTPDQMDALGALWRDHPDCLMQTHLSEQTQELAWMAKLFPDAPDYLSVYEKFGLLGARGVYGHAIHLTDREIGALSDAGAAIAHCPTSNSFIGSGLCDVSGLAGRGVGIGLGTDTGGGSSFSMLRTMAACYEIAMLRDQTALHPMQLLWLATAGGARTLHVGDKIGTLAPGYEADLAVLDLASTPAIAQRAARAGDIWDATFPTIMMGDDRAIADVWVAGQRVQP